MFSCHEHLGSICSIGHNISRKQANLEDKMFVFEVLLIAHLGRHGESVNHGEEISPLTALR